MSGTATETPAVGPSDDEMAAMPVVLGSDDPPVFNTALLKEYQRVRDHFGLSARQLRALAQASIEASFAPPALKQQLLNGHRDL